MCKKLEHFSNVRVSSFAKIGRGHAAHGPPFCQADFHFFFSDGFSTGFREGTTGTRMPRWLCLYDLTYPNEVGCPIIHARLCVLVRG